VNIDGHNGTGAARIEADDPALLRALAYVCATLADELAD
jgi:hypothetical protein